MPKEMPGLLTKHCNFSFPFGVVVFFLKIFTVITVQSVIKSLKWEGEHAGQRIEV